MSLSASQGGSIIEHTRASNTSETGAHNHQYHIDCRNGTGTNKSRDIHERGLAMSESYDYY